jgi:tetratricopeptide (TPR) repeat protein
MTPNGDDEGAVPPKVAFAATVIGHDATLDGAMPAVRVPEVTLPPGTVLAGRYLVGALLGRGGMGTVYAVRDGDLDEDVALKLLRPDLAHDEGYRTRLRAEVRLARRVSHPNVCRVHDLGVAGELAFVTMELVQGQTVRHMLAEMRAQRQAPFELAQIVDMVVQIGSALTAAHRAGVIHRDVKPDNVILTDGRAVLTDFGVAMHSAERTDPVAGTPAYIAPEVMLDEAFDHRVDVYALAVLAYELLAGHVPFEAKSLEAADLLAAERPAYPPLPENLANPDVRNALDHTLQRALAFDPTIRTATIDRFTEAFAVAARGAPATTVANISPPATRGDSTGRPPGTEVGSTTTSKRRHEVRVATAFAWRRTGGDPTAAEAVERIVVDAGGVPIRVGVGDVLAVFGAPRSLGDDADRAARAALASVSIHGGQAGLDATRVLLRPGLSELAGPEVAAGAVALAASAPLGQVVASSVSARQLAARFDVASAATGRRIVGVRPLGTSLAIQSYRARELAALDMHLERAFRERVAVCVEVRGAPGSGKTRLREALVHLIEARREVEWLVAAASPVGAPAPLSTIRAASAEWYEAAISGGAIVDPAQRQIAARRWLEARAAGRPIVVIVEDVQWADPSTCALLDDLRTSLDAVPVAVVTLRRVDDDDDSAPVGGNVITLGPLDDTTAAQLARSIAPSASADAINHLVARAAGNPFFIEELARELTEAHPSIDTAILALPASIEAVIQARLDHLPETANQVVLAAAVIGRAFWRSAVAMLVNLDTSALDAALAELERRGVITATAPVTLDDDRYQFNQNIVRDVAYARIPPRQRRAHHASVAQWLESKATTDRKDDLPLVLDAAYHREQSGDNAGAAFAYRRAGTRCIAVFANREAAAALQRAVELTSNPDAALHEELGDAISETTGPAAAEAVYQAASAALATSDTPGHARLLYKLGHAAARRGDSALALERYRKGLALAAPDGNTLAPWAQEDPRTAAKLFGGLGWTLGYVLARVEEGHPLCERAVALLEGSLHRRDLAYALSRLGGTYMRACRFADQLRTNQRNLDIGCELGDLRMQLTAHINLGVVYGLLGAIDAAVASTITARQLAARTGATATAGLCASNLGGLYLEQGRLADAKTVLDEALDILSRTSNRYVLCETYAFQARLAAAEGDLAAARHHAERSRALARELGNPLDAAIATRILAQIASRGGDHSTARMLIDEALAAVTTIDAFEAIRTRAARARILRAAGDPTAATATADVRRELERLGATRELEVLDVDTEAR